MEGGEVERGVVELEVAESGLAEPVESSAVGLLVCRSVAEGSEEEESSEGARPLLTEDSRANGRGEAVRASETSLATDSVACRGWAEWAMRTLSPGVKPGPEKVWPRTTAGSRALMRLERSGSEDGGGWAGGGWGGGEREGDVGLCLASPRVSHSVVASSARNGSSRMVKLHMRKGWPP